MATSRIFKELNSAEIDKVISNLYGSDTTIIDCGLMEGGVFNTTYLVKTDSDSNGIVLRVAPINQHLLFDFEKSMMAAEPLFYEMLQDKNIPTSEVIHYDNSYNVIDREYIIFKYIRSVPMNDVSVPKDVKSRLYQRLGEIVSLMHNIKSEKFGWRRPDNELELYENWGTFLKRFAREIADRASNYGVFNDGELNRFINIFNDTTVFNQITQARMVHADLWEGNVLVGENDGKWDIAAIIDVDKAIFGDKEFEFASPVLINDDFLSGYGCRLDESSASTFRRNAYKLLDSFMYAYIWLVQFENIERYELAKRNGLSVLDLFDSSPFYS
jgi:aminoglycoside phosphotransferase (APT) family kinase protein